MPIEINSLFSSISGALYGTGAIHGIFSSVLHTSIALAMAVILLVVLIYPRRGTPAWVLFKLFLYTFLATLGMVAMHDSFVKNSYRERYHDNNVDSFMAGIRTGAIAPDDRVVASAPVAGGGEPELRREERALDSDPLLRDALSSGGAAESAAAAAKSDAPLSAADMLDDLERRLPAAR